MLVNCPYCQKHVPGMTGFQEAGKTLVLAAHRHHHPAADSKGWIPAVFHAFTPDRVEYVVKGTESEAELARMEKRGITPVHVVREGSLPGVDEQAERSTYAEKREGAAKAHDTAVENREAKLKAKKKGGAK